MGAVPGGAEVDGQGSGRAGGHSLALSSCHLSWPSCSSPRSEAAQIGKVGLIYCFYFRESQWGGLRDIIGGVTACHLEPGIVFSLQKEQAGAGAGWSGQH